MSNEERYKLLRDLSEEDSEEIYKFAMKRSEEIIRQIEEDGDDEQD